MLMNSLFRVLYHTNTFNIIELNSLNSLTIEDESFKKVTSFSLGTMNSLEILEIGNHCFKSIATDIRLYHFPELISLKIGRNSFYDESNGQSIDKIFQVYNNSKLLSIEIGEHSFSKFGSTFSISSLPLLQNLTIGSIENESNNFMNIQSFSISSIMSTMIFIV